jgi:hypothetical protein
MTATTPGATLVSRLDEEFPGLGHLTEEELGTAARLLEGLSLGRRLSTTEEAIRLSEGELAKLTQRHKELQEYEAQLASEMEGLAEELNNMPWAKPVEPATPAAPRVRRARPVAEAGAEA